MNKVILIGNLSKDPETRTTTSGKTVSTFTLAVNRRMKNADGSTTADFITCVAWNQLGELVGKYLAKGRKCCVIGSMQTRSYDAQDGSKRYVTEVLADEVEFLSAKTDETKDAPAQMKNPPAPAPAQMVESDDSELPF